MIGTGVSEFMRDFAYQFFQLGQDTIFGAPAKAAVMSAKAR
jgi:hypothetical protein